MKLKTALAGVLLSSSTGLFSPKPLVDLEQLKCLATNIYYEARGEPRDGQIAVAAVTLNRADNSSVCEEVFRPNQFSWTLKTKTIKYDEASLTVAWEALTIRPNFSATHYHNSTVKPKWSYSFKKITKIGNHTFYAQYY